MNDQIPFGLGRVKHCRAVFFERFLRSEYFYLNMTKVDPRGCGLYLFPLPFLQHHLILKHILCSSTALLKELLALSVLEAPEGSGIQNGFPLPSIAMM